jgi:hypothetical protein
MNHEFILKLLEQFAKNELESIKNYCKNNNENCSECPFNMPGAWLDYCMFMGPTPHEGRTPDEWEIDKINFNKY